MIGSEHESFNIFGDMIKLCAERWEMLEISSC